MHSRTKELELLLLCSTLHGPAGRAGRVRELARAGLDWTQVLELAEWHRLTPMLAHNVRRWCDAELEPWVRASLEEAYRANSLRNLRATGELLRVLELLESRGIPCLPFKGPALAMKLYGDVGLRQFRDVDLLVPDERYDAAQALLAAASSLKPVHGRGRRSTQHEIECELRSAHGVTVELHCALHYRYEGFFIPARELPGRGHWTELCGKPVRDLPDEEWFVLLSIHGARHGYYRLHWLTGLAELAANRQLDWQRVIDLSAEWRARRCLHLTLTVMAELLEVHADLPPNSREPAAVSRLAKAVGSRIETGPLRVPGERVGHQWGVRLQDTLADRTRYAAWGAAGVARRTVRQAFGARVVKGA